jgi:hypothetical protein
MLEQRLPAAALAAALLVLGVSSAAAGGKSHLGVPTQQILNLTAAAADDDSENDFRYDTGGPVFTVPDGFVFVLTDVQAIPASSGSTAVDRYSFVLGGGGRSFVAAFHGARYARSFTSGLVIESGETLIARNSSLSAGDIAVIVQGYLTKGPALPPGTPF